MSANRHTDCRSSVDTKCCVNSHSSSKGIREPHGISYAFLFFLRPALRPSPRRSTVGPSPFGLSPPPEPPSLLSSLSSHDQTLPPRLRPAAPARSRGAIRLSPALRQECARCFRRPPFARRHLYHLGRRPSAHHCQPRPLYRPHSRNPHRTSRRSRRGALRLRQQWRHVDARIRLRRPRQRRQLHQRRRPPRLFLLSRSGHDRPHHRAQRPRLRQRAQSPRVSPARQPRARPLPPAFQSRLGQCGSRRLTRIGKQRQGQKRHPHQSRRHRRHLARGQGQSLRRVPPEFRYT